MNVLESLVSWLFPWLFFLLIVDFRVKTDKTEGAYRRHFYSQKFTSYLARCFSFDVDKPNLSLPSIKALREIFVTSHMIKIDDPDVLISLPYL
jgi:hypothetical protein